MANLLADTVITPYLARGGGQENCVRDVEEHPCAPAGRPDPWMVYCGQVIRDMRDAAGLTLEALGREVGFSESHMSHIECGTAYPRLVKLFQILRVLGIRMSYPFVPEPPPVHSEKREPKHAKHREHHRAFDAPATDRSAA